MKTKLPGYSGFLGYYASKTRCCHRDMKTKLPGNPDLWVTMFNEDQVAWLLGFSGLPCFQNSVLS